MRWFPPLLHLLVAVGPVGAADVDPKAAEFFEKEVRPLLVEQCVKCHGGVKTGGGLDLTSRDAVLKGGETGPAAVVNQPDDSLLLKSVRHVGGVKKMPKKADKLADRQIDTLARWVQIGLPWSGPPIGDSAQRPTGKITDEQRKFWSFQPVQRQEPPTVRDSAWVRSEIDRFILAKLEAQNLRPAAEADARTLLRRATFDLTGLPPTPAEIDAFLKDDSPEAFARVVDRLLASPRYGERWGRHWLDLVRYTDSFDARILGNDGNIMDCTEAWRYRDWVVDAFNRDLPYDRFVIDQIAGDLQPAADGSSINAPGIIATGFLAIGNWGGGDADKEKLLTDIVDDQIDAVTRTFLGATMACARCHDHKFDPFLQADYYGLAGIFMSTHILPNVGPKTNGPPMLRIPLAPAELVQAREKHLAHIAALEGQLKGKKPEELPEVRAELAEWKKTLSPAVPFANGAQEGGVPGSPQAGIHDVRIHHRGNYATLGDVVARRFPLVLAGDTPKPITQGSGRNELARWIAAPGNPLTARVMVNRVWQYHFGAGIVRTPSNFGKLGEPPSHPELLDWLAQRFVDKGWSLKALHREIMLSATYRQASAADSATRKADPDNRLFGKMNRRRLEAEALRDSLLSATGRLDTKAGGPAVRDFNVPRRTLYLMTIRSDRSGFGPLFDAADATALVDRRTISTVAPQALFLLNNAFVLDQARTLAQRLQAEAEGDDGAGIERAYVLLYGRLPSATETRIGLDYLKRLRASGTPLDQSWEPYCHALLCANEFIYVD